MQWKLNGWRRLWIVLSVIYLMVVCWFGFSALPAVDSYEQAKAIFYLSESFDADMEFSRAIGDRVGEDKASQDRIIGARLLRSTTHEEETDAEIIKRIGDKYVGKIDFTKLDAEAAATIDAQKSRRLAFIVNTAAYWIVPVLVIYLLGSAIGWVVRGFRKK
jgi:hypothetical protein